MPTYYCFAVRFLQPYCHARGAGDEAEWPPSPLRVFQALVAAAAARWNERMHLEYAAPALRWLECRPAPIIMAVVGVPSDVKYRLYVPDNVGDKVARSWSAGREASIARIEKDVRVTHLNGEAVHYLYPLAHDGCPHLEVLVAAARSLTHLGWGIDMVAVDAYVISDDDAARLPGERWLPVGDAGANRLRVPIDGTLQALLDKHRAFLDRLGPDGFTPVPPLSAFRVVGYRRSTDSPARPFAAFAFYRPDANTMRPFPADRAIAVAGMVRSLTGRLARQTGHCAEGTDLDSWVNDYVMGHGTAEGLRPRFSYLPLPTIRPPAVAGDIRRVVVAEPPGGDGRHASWARRALRGQVLVSEQGQEEAILLPLRADDGVIARYTTRSQSWATVTPVVLPGSDEGKFTKAEKLFFKTLRHAGYSTDAIADIDFRNVSFWVGGCLARRFQRPEYLRKGHWSVYHMRVRWWQPVNGPLALGAGRHCGLGTFAAQEE